MFWCAIEPVWCPGWLWLAPLAIGTRPTRSRSATAAIIALMAFTQRCLALSPALWRDARYRARQWLRPNIKLPNRISPANVQRATPGAVISSRWILYVQPPRSRFRQLMLNHRLQVDDSFRIRTHQPSGTGNGTGRQPAKASGSGRCGFLHHHRDRVSTTAVRQNAPRGLRGPVGSTPGSLHLPRARRSLITTEPA